MKNRDCLLLLLCCLWRLNSYSQVTISPEIGISYAPFVLYGANTVNESKRPALLLGMNGQLNLSKKALANVRISYVERGNIKWLDLCFCPTREYLLYDHNDLTIDLDVLYSLNKNINLGIGPSIIRKIKTKLIIKDTNFTEVNNFNDFYFALNVTSSFIYKRLSLKLMYIRRFDPDDVRFFYTEGIHRFDATVSYALFGVKE